MQAGQIWVFACWLQILDKSLTEKGFLKSNFTSNFTNENLAGIFDGKKLCYFTNTIIEIYLQKNIS